jgi:hypothetical protein
VFDFESNVTVASQASTSSVFTDDTVCTSVSALSRKHTATSPFQEVDLEQGELTTATGASRNSNFQRSAFGNLGQVQSGPPGKDAGSRGRQEAGGPVWGPLTQGLRRSPSAPSAAHAPGGGGAIQAGERGGLGAERGRSREQQQQLRPGAPRGARRSRSASDTSSSSSDDEDDCDLDCKRSVTPSVKQQQGMSVVVGAAGAAARAQDVKGQHELTGLAATVLCAGTGASPNKTRPTDAAGVTPGYTSRDRGYGSGFVREEEVGSERSSLEREQEEQQEAEAYGLVRAGGRVLGGKRSHRASLPGDFREQEPGVDPKDGAAVYVHHLSGEGGGGEGGGGGGWAGGGGEGGRGKGK